MKYERLKAGDVRKKGDEVRSMAIPMNDLRKDQTEWHKTELIGVEVFASDLCHLELRRPIK